MNIQKTINYLALFLPTVGVTLSACKNEIVDQTIENTNPIPAVLTQQDKDFTRLAKVVSKALYEDVTFRDIIKKEAEIMFDGDYDILLSKFQHREIVTNNKGTVIIGSYLNIYFDRLELTTDGFANKSDDNIADLIALYPDLQISVPVNIENWDTEYVPEVAVIPSNYDEKTTNTITAYKNDVSIEDVFHEKDDYIGEATLEYIDPTSTTIEFPNYGFKLDIANY